MKSQKLQKLIIQLPGYTMEVSINKPIEPTDLAQIACNIVRLAEKEKLAQTEKEAQ